MGVEEARVLSVTSETPASVYAGHKALIQRNSPSAWTSGTAQARGYSIKFKHSNKWSNQLMGWQSGDVTVDQPCINLAFESAEQAVLFCERSGWPYEVVGEPTDKAPIALDPNGAGNQYSYNILPLTVQRNMKAAGLPRRAKAIFAHPTAPAATGVSTWGNVSALGGSGRVLAAQQTNAHAHARPTLHTLFTTTPRQWRHTGYGPDAWKPRNDKIKFDQSAWSGPGWREAKEMPPPGEEGEGKH